MKDMIDVVIPVADKNDEITQKCLRHLDKTQRYPFRPILIEDRGPSFSFGKSMNKGIWEAESDIVIGMDSDSFPCEDAFKMLVDFAEKYPNVGYFGVRIRQKYKIGFNETLGLIYSYDPLQAFKFNMLNLAPLFFLKRIVKRKLTHDLLQVNEFVPGMIGQATSLFAIRKDCWSDVGGFDEKFWLSHSDIDLCFRIILSDRWKITVCPYVTTYHLGTITRKTEPTKDYRRILDQERFDMKWPHEKILEVVEASKRGKFVIPNSDSFDRGVC